MKKIFIIPLSIILAGAFVNVFSGTFTPVEESLKRTVTLSASKNLTLTERVYENTIEIGAIGDILLHDRVYKDAATETGYDFSSMFEPVREMLSGPDLTIANQESIAAGSELGLSSYPTFNSPHEISDTLKNVGIDIVSLANNHSLDKGERGILKAIEYYNKIGMPYVGINKSEEDRQRDRILNVNGISIGFLSYTYGTNGIPIPEGKDYLVNYLEEKRIYSDIKELRPKVDLILINAHWGLEYKRNPSDEQRRLANLMAEAGADLIIGHHPHVLQPIEWIENNPHRTLVVYSLGNFISGQENDYKDIGGMVTVSVNKRSSAKGTITTVSDVAFTPTYVTNQHNRNYRIQPFDNADVFGQVKASKQELTKFMLNQTQK